MLLRSYPSSVVADGNVMLINGFAFISCDLQRNPTELRRSILDFLGADRTIRQPRDGDYNSWPGWKSFCLPIKFDASAQFFKKELKTCAALLGASERVPARYVSHCCYSSGTCWTISIYFFGASGSRSPYSVRWPQRIGLCMALR